MSSQRRYSKNLPLELFGSGWEVVPFLHGCRVRQKREQSLGIGFKTALSAPSQETTLGGGSLVQLWLDRG